uniref:Myb-like domain-containing protein n=1 Tax=Leptobrachium leishanense TaxID=445787 RepID=A0A8C5QZU7_9ANUR
MEESISGDFVHVNEHRVRKHKKRSLETTSAGVDRSTIKLEPETPKRKKKKRDVLVEGAEAGSQTDQTEDSFSDHFLPISAAGQSSEHKSRKHSKKSLPAPANVEVVSSPVMPVTETPTQKRKKKKRDVLAEGADAGSQTDQTEDSFSDHFLPISAAWLSLEHKSRKHNKKSLPAPTNANEVSSAVKLEPETPTKKQRKKKEILAEGADETQALDCQSSIEENYANDCLEGPSDPDRTLDNTQRKKRNHVDTSYLSPPSTPFSLGDSLLSVDSVPGRRKKKTKHRHTEVMENGSQSPVGLSEAADHSINTLSNVSTTQSEVTNPDLHSKARKSAKKHKKIKSPASSALLDESRDLENSFASSNPVDKAQATAGNEENAVTLDNTEDLPENPSDASAGSEDEFTCSRLRKSKKDSLINLPQRHLKLLLEYFPQVKTLCASTVKTLISQELERIKDAKMKGIKFNTGRFTEQENQQLRENAKAFMAISGIKNEDMLFHSYRYPDERAFIERLKKDYNFRSRMGEGIRRTLSDICHRGVKLFDLSGQKGHYTEEEVAELKKQSSIHGNKWTTIGAIIGRSHVTVQLKASQIRRERNRGSWQDSETNRLIEVVKEFVLAREKEVTGTEEEPEMIAKQNLYKGIPWIKIAETVKTRNWTQCKRKWMEIISVRMNNSFSMFEGLQGLRMKTKIITWLHERRYAESGQVNWEEFANAMGNIPPLWLQTKVFDLKHKNVAGWQNLNFREIVDHLYTLTLPVVEARLMKELSKKQEDEELFKIRNDYSPNEIFYKYVGKEIDSTSAKSKRKRRSV